MGSLPAELRAEILLSAQHEVAAANAEVTARNVNTTKHDKARLLHLRADSRLSLIWANAFSTLDRQQLDARNTATFTENEPWAVLANAFNNYAEYAYRNACLQYEGCCSKDLCLLFSANGLPKRLNGIYIGVPGMESITNLCADLNPTDSSRPVRDAGWLRTQFKALRSITVVNL